MSRLSLLSSLAVLVLVPATASGAGACPTAGIPTELQPRSSARSAVLCLVNAERRAGGLAALGADRALTRAARRHAGDMVRRGYFAHRSPEGRSPLQRIRRAGFGGPEGFTTGENLGWSEPRSDTPYAMVDAWMRSEPHREVILFGGFRSAGVATVRGLPRKSGGAGTTYAMTFGT